MTVSTSANKTIVPGNGAQTVFPFSFVGVAAADIGVIYTDSAGNQTTLTQGPGATQFQVALTAAVAPALWGIGGTVTYNPSGTPIATGSTLTIFRTLPLTQLTSLQNQASYGQYASPAEMAIDQAVMLIQQVSELFARALVAPIVDATAPGPLPTIAQRANLALLFDGSGNPIAGALPASGAISSAMQAVVNAASLALGRTAFGLGAMAVEGIGAGLQDDGAGNARVDSPLTSDSTNQAVDATFHLKARIATGPIAYTLARANTLWNGFGFWIHVVSGGAVTLAVDSHDTIEGLSSGTSGSLPIGAWAFVTTDAAASGNWRVRVQSTLNFGAPTVQTLTGSGTCTPGAGAKLWRVRTVGGGGGGAAATTNSGTDGGTTTFGTWTALGGKGGTPGGNAGAGGTGGATGTGILIGRYNGSSGQGGIQTALAITCGGGKGGDNPFFGGGGAKFASGTGADASGNSGGGGQGGGAATSNSGGGGGSGECVEFWVVNPTATAFVCAGTAAGGAAGGRAGGIGAAAQIIVEEYYIF